MMKRRLFLREGGCLGLGCLLSGAIPVLGQDSPLRVLPDELSAGEKRLVEASPMATGLLDYFGREYSCAESILAVILRALDLPENCVWAAAAFGGGMGRKDLCGFITGGLMGLGFAADTLDLPRKEAKSWCAARSREYWKWWESAAPFRCAEIRPAGSDSGRCRRLGQLALLELERKIPVKRRSG